MNRTLKTILVQGANFGLQVLFIFAAARALGPRDQGIYALVRTSVFLVESLMWLGLSSGLSYFIAKDFDRYHGPLLKLSLLYVLGLSVLGLALLPAARFFLGPEKFAGSWRLWVLSAVWVMSLTSALFFQKIFIGQQRFDRYNLATLVNTASVMLFLGVILWARRPGLTPLVLCHVASNVTALLVSIACHRKFLRPADFSAEVPKGFIRDVFRVGMRGYLSTIAFLLLYRMDFYFVGYFLGTSTLGVYSVAVFAVEGLQKVPDWLGMILAPKVASDPAAAGAVESKFMKMSFSYAVLAAALAAVFVKGGALRVLGKSYAVSGPIILALLPRVILHSLKAIYAAQLAGRGYTLYHPLSGVVALAILAGVDAFLLRGHGIFSAVAGITFAYVAAVGIMAFGCHRLRPSGGPPFGSEAFRVEETASAAWEA